MFLSVDEFEMLGYMKSLKNFNIIVKHMIYIN